MRTDTTIKQIVTHKRRRLLIVTGAAMAVGAVVGTRFLVAPVYEGGHLGVRQAHARAVEGTILLVDIRRPEEWAETGIPEAAHPIDMRRNDFTTALLAARGPDTARPIALICARGVRSARLSTRLAKAGFDAILDVPEGMLGSAAGPGWLASGLPTRPPTETPG